MTWREDLRRVTFGDGRRMVGASFRGVPFFVESSDRSGGRRSVVHEFPQREDPYIEDLGRRARSFRVEGYVVGDDYITQRDALLTALEDVSGPGELVHPSHGVRRVVCLTASTRESRSDGGMAMFSIEFVEAPAQAIAPTAVPDPSGVVATAADEAVAAVQAGFEGSYSTTGLPSFAVASAATALSSAAESLRAQLAPAVQTAQELAALDAQLHQLVEEASSLARQPTEVLVEFRAAITGLVETAATAPEALLEALIAAYDVDLGPAVPATTSTRRRERDNQVAITGALRSLMAIEAARLAPTVDFESLQAATAARDAVAGLLEAEAASADDTAYPALVALRSEVLTSVPGAAVLARETTIEQRVALPSLVLAYRLHGTVDQEPDILARNNVRHPGFVSGSLVVLTDA